MDFTKIYGLWMQSPLCCTRLLWSTQTCQKRTWKFWLMNLPMFILQQFLWYILHTKLCFWFAWEVFFEDDQWCYHKVGLWILIEIVVARLQCCDSLFHSMEVFWNQDTSQKFFSFLRRMIMLSMSKHSQY